MRDVLASILLPVIFLFLVLLPGAVIGFFRNDSSLIAKSRIRALLVDFLSRRLNPPRDKRFFAISGVEYGLYCGSFIVDKDTKVIYLFCKFGSAGGLTPLIDSDGNPILYEGE